MSYYTERQGLRVPVEKTYSISIDMYALIFDCCNKYYDNIAWKYPNQCEDRLGCYGVNFQKLNTALKFEIPSLYRDEYDNIIVPEKPYHSYEKDPKYDQYALLDYIEFMAQNICDVEIGTYHDFFKHYHLIFKKTSEAFKNFKDEINNIFIKTGLLYRLTDEKIIERIVENSPLTQEVETDISFIEENGCRELLEEAIKLHKQPSPKSSQYAVEKMWDALERLKTYYIGVKKDKLKSTVKLIKDMSCNNSDFYKLFDDEFKTLTAIGNSYRIRHHEIDKIEITDVRHCDYFFNRCLSLIALAIQYLE